MPSMCSVRSITRSSSSLSTSTSLATATSSASGGSGNSAISGAASSSGSSTLSSSSSGAPSAGTGAGSSATIGVRSPFECASLSARSTAGVAARGFALAGPFLLGEGDELDIANSWGFANGCRHTRAPGGLLYFDFDAAARGLGGAGVRTTVAGGIVLERLRGNVQGDGRALQHGAGQTGQGERDFA